MKDVTLFVDCLERNFQFHPNEFPLISNLEIRNFIERIHSLSKEGANLSSYDKIMDPLIISSLAHFLYLKIHSIDLNANSDRMPFHSNYIPFHF